MHARRLAYPTLFLLASCSAAATQSPALTLGKSTLGAVEVRSYDGDEDKAGGDAGQDGRKLTRSAWLVFEVDDEGKDRELMNNRAEKLAVSMGGYLATQSAYGFTMRVPADRLDEVMTELEKFGDVADRGYRVHDVTRQHRDLGVRIENAKKLKSRLLALLDKAENVKEILAVEKELARVTTELETLEAEMRNLTKLIALATIEVRYEDDVSPGPVGWVFYGVYTGVKWLFVWD